MADQQKDLKDPMVLVKKADGSTERVPLHMIRSTQTPETKRRVPLLIAKKRAGAVATWSPRDHASLLDEELQDHEVMDHATDRITTHDHIVDEILKDFPTTIAPEAQMRARSLIVSYLKGIRDRNQFHEYAVASVQKGGLGLTKEEAARLTLVTDEAVRRQSPQSGRQRVPSRQPDRAKQNAPSAGQGAVSTTTPVRDVFVQAPDSASDRASARPVTGIRTSRGMSRAVNTPKKTVHDMSMSAEASPAMGPGEEMATFSLIDFRRLADTPDHAGGQLMAKFQGWKQESFVLYLDARRAWFHSPLFCAYQDTVIDAINSGQTLTERLAGSRTAEIPSFEETAALIDINKTLRH